MLVSTEIFHISSPSWIKSYFPGCQKFRISVLTVTRTLVVDPPEIRGMKISVGLDLDRAAPG